MIEFNDLGSRHQTGLDQPARFLPLFPMARKVGRPVSLARSHLPYQGDCLDLRPHGMSRLQVEIMCRAPGQARHQR